MHIDKEGNSIVTRLEKIRIRVYGEAEMIQFRCFDKVEWNKLLLDNKISSDEFMNQLFDPDFFLVNMFPHYSETINAKSIRDFFGSNFFYGPLYNQMAFVDMKFARKKVYRGTLNTFLGKDTIFPLVNLQFYSFEIASSENSVYICAVVRTAGQVVNLFSVSESFDSEKFMVNVNDLTIGTHQFKLVSGFKYNEIEFKRSKTDSVIRNQWCFLI
jgi:hypothetical protein